MTHSNSHLIDQHVELLQEKLGYQFKKPELLRMALTHPSFSAESNSQNVDNQRLEYLGDSVIQLILTEELYRKFPDASEGTLTKWRARLVSRDALSDFAMSLELGQSIQIGKGEDASGGRARKSILSDCLEAVFGALYLDAGLDVSQRCILEIVKTSFEAVVESPEEGNPKGKLQEKLQAIHPESPSYVIVSSAGPDHSKNFVAAVIWREQELGRGEGSSKKAAEAEAASNALELQGWAGS